MTSLLEASEQEKRVFREHVCVLQKMLHDMLMVLEVGDTQRAKLLALASTESAKYVLFVLQETLEDIA